MKKVLLTVAMLFAIGMYSHASESDSIRFNYSDKYKLEINHRRLACVLDLNSTQMKDYDGIISELENDMLFASLSKDDDSVDGAVKKNLKYMRRMLNKRQYEKYYLLLNLTLEHRGFFLKEER